VKGENCELTKTKNFFDKLGFIKFLWRILDNDRECRSAVKSVDYFSKRVVGG